MLFYHSDYQTLLFFRKSSIIEQEWQELSKSLNPDKFMEEMYTFFDYIKQFKPQNVLVNLEQLKYDLPENFEEELRKEIQDLKVKVKKIAIVNTEARTTLNTLIDNLVHNSYFRSNIRIFDNAETAIAWLHSKSIGSQKLSSDGSTEVSAVA